MLASTLIGFREALEAALIIGIILAYLKKTNNEKYNNVIYLGIISAIIASIISAILFNILMGGFEGRAEEIFEGVAMVLAGVVLTYMIIWMSRQKGVAYDLKKRVDDQLTNGVRYGLFFVSFLAVFREGVETVLFLEAASIAAEGNHSLLGALIGIILAVILGYFIFVSSRKVNLKAFFKITSFLLILFAGGLFAHGLHEFQEAGIIPIAKENIWDINPTVNEDGSYPTLHEKGVVGSLAKGLFGYNGNPNLLEFLVWIGYIVPMMGFLFYSKGNEKKN